MHNNDKKPSLWAKFVKFFNSWPGTILFVLLFLFFVAQNFIIPSGSMVRTMLVGDMLFVKKFAYGVPTPHIPWLEVPIIPNTDGHIIDGKHPKRADIVIFRYPPNPKMHFVKRCVAVGGDELFVKDKDLYIHHHEGNTYIKEHFDEKEYDIIQYMGKLWVKNPYMKEHPGIWHDPKITRQSAMIPANTLIDHKNAHLIRLDGDDVLVNFVQDDTMARDYDISQRVDFMGRTWVKNPKETQITKEAFMRIQNSTDFHEQYTFVEQDSYQTAQNAIFDYMPNGLPFRVPNNHFFMMGDNRDHSSDSRFWGTVPYGLVEGTPWFIYFSIDTKDYTIRWDRVGTTVEALEERLHNE